jgi:cell shape-determining protein MreC
MTYRSGRLRKSRIYLNAALGIVAFSLFVYFWPQFRAEAYPLIEPLVRGYGVSKAVSAALPEAVSTYFSSHASLAGRNRELETDVEHLENVIAEKEALLREMNLLSRDVDEEAQVSVIVLYPIAEDISKLYSTILLSKGYKEGIENGSLVYVRGRQSVCEIVEVYDRTSLCELLSRGDRITEGVTGSSSITLSMSGEGGGNFLAEAPTGSKVEPGEDVYLRGNPSFKLGTIVSIVRDEQSTGSRIYVRGAYNPVTSSVFYIDREHVR